MVAPGCLYGRCDSSYLGDRKCIYHSTPLAQRTVNDNVFIIYCLCVQKTATFSVGMYYIIISVI